MVQHFLVKGRVQGVGFRWFVHREAAEIGLRGWVRNTEDGHVEVLAAGEPDQLQSCTPRCTGLARQPRGRGDRTRARRERRREPEVV